MSGFIDWLAGLLGQRQEPVRSDYAPFPSAERDWCAYPGCHHWHIAGPENYGTGGMQERDRYWREHNRLRHGSAARMPMIRSTEQEWWSPRLYGDSHPTVGPKGGAGDSGASRR